MNAANSALPPQSTAAAAPVRSRRMRQLMWLAGITAFTVVLALVSVLWRSRATEAAFTPTLAFPGLAERINDVAVISVETKDKAFTITRKAGGGWVLPGKAGFAASAATVRSTLIALSTLELLQTRTQRAEWHQKLDLNAPKEGGQGAVVSLSDGSGKSMGSLIVGKAAEGLNAGGRSALYVRRPAEAQTYAAAGQLDLKRKEADWLEARFLDFDRSRVREAAIRPAQGPAYVVRRAKAEDQNFTLVTPIPAGRQLRTETEPNGVGQALFNLSIEDVVPATEIDFKAATYAAFLTFDGLALSFRLVEKDQAFWTTISVTRDPAFVPPAPQAGQSTPIPPETKAKMLNDLTAGWAFRLSRFKGVLMTSPLVDLTKALEGSGATPGTAQPAAPPAQPRGRRRGR